MRNQTTTFKNLTVWKESHKLALIIYKITHKFPRHEILGLTNQIRRASVSVPSNIAKGSARTSKKERLKFLYIALGSLREIDSQSTLAKDLQYITPKEYQNLYQQINHVAKLLYGLIKKYQKEI